MKMWNRTGNTTMLLSYLKGFEILQQERREQVKIMVVEHLHGILFHKSRPVNKQPIYQSINQSILKAIALLGFWSTQLTTNHKDANSVPDIGAMTFFEWSELHLAS